ncbi:MAG TPA: hypothetical protein VGI03_07270 [Verrucomicrobiae bacterium]|jgi:hypothetical protein
MGPIHPPAVHIVEPADGAIFHAPANIRLVALATPYGTDLGPEKAPPFIHSDEWELVSSPESQYTVAFLSGTNSLSLQNGSLVSARVKPVPGRAEPLLMVLVGYPALEWTWHDVPAGKYTLTARATNEKGLVAISTPVQITVLP